MTGHAGAEDSFEPGVLRNRRVLVVDDQDEIHDDFRETLEGDRPMASDAAALAFRRRPEPSFRFPSFDLLHADSGENACAVIEEGCRAGSRVAVAYVDIRMPPGIDGIETVNRMRSIDRDIEVVIMTAYADRPLREMVDGMRFLHKVLYIRKPFAQEEIQQITLALAMKWNVERALAVSRQRQDEEHRRLQAVLDATGDAIALYEDERLVLANRPYERLFDLSSEALRKLPRSAAAKRFGEVSPPAGSGEGAAAGTAGEMLVAPAGRTSAPGRDRRFLRSCRPVPAGDSETPMGDLIVYRDVSESEENRRMKAEVRQLRAQVEDEFSFGGLVGSSAPMREVYALLKRAVQTDITVLVRGESGTGKELVARALHFRGSRRKGPFVAVNMAAIPETLIESELFGHERGSFTSAAGRRAGCFEQAHGGTLLLDEIGDMPTDLQSKLLRVLQERQVRRVGSDAAIPVDVRIVAVTNRDLEARMRAGAFREDLYYRIAVFPIAIPPLRRRKDDILLLAAHFLQKHAARLGSSVQKISEGAARLLAGYEWPGNVRELENVICRSLVLETTDALRPDSLPAHMAAAPESAAPGPVLSLVRMERQAIARALDASDGNLTRTARTLGIARSTLHRKMKKYDLALPTAGESGAGAKD